MTWLVVWKIDVEADSPREAAEEALRIQRKPMSIATVFEVFNSETDDKGITVDLEEMGREED